MNAFEDHIQWNAVKEVCSRLQGAGYEALLAGGCVRDLIMQREPNDFDVATNATPDQVEALFEKSIAVGKAFGVIVIPFTGPLGAFQIEVATFREDLEYKDGRRPEGVKFSTAKADAQRRDFTVNALFYDVAKKEIVSKVLRTVGDPNHRFDEDKLRILRAIRFAAQLDFEIEAKTLRAIEERASEVNVVSKERIRDEILKLLKSKHRRKGLQLLRETDVMRAIFPLLANAVDDCQEKWLSAFDHLESNVDEAALLALFVWPHAKTAHELKLDSGTLDVINNVFRELDHALNPSKLSKGELAFILTKSFAPTLLLVADTLARANTHEHELGDRTTWNAALKIARPDGHNSVQPLLTGKDLIAQGIKPGPNMGQILHAVFLKQLDGEITSKSEALQMAAQVERRATT
jgi:poly(A) polymerase